MESSGQDIDLDQIYSVIGNPYLRAIIRKIGESGEASFSELKEAIKTSTGNLYYNLDKLSGLVEKNERRKYVLTEKGVKLYKFLTENEARVKSLLLEKRGLSLVIEKYILPVIVPENLVSYMYSQPVIPFLALLIYFTTAAVATLTGSYVVFGLDQLFVPIVYREARIVLWISGISLTLSILEFSSRLLGGDPRIGLDYFSSMFLATILLAIPALANLDIILTNILYRVVQVIVLGLLTAIIKVYKKLPTERAFISVFVAYYASFTLAILVQRLF
ncbi:MAG: winged helix-turn-helix domain-containing protein [Infirmifilum sp.]|jgi:DNA-binding HxlR family transcriptional regulator|uniref:winged helix-turn-helix domain-containing protein n=1 Tax=Infirmifilum TaxID=2856573 RepID=UPI00069A5D44|nr:helix-turn-helix domain-containing protein [Infirmifilum uzonense]